MHAVRRSLPYLGACFTEVHVDMIYKKLLSRILSSSMDANDDDFYNAQLSTLMATTRGDNSTPPAGHTAQETTKAAAKDAPKAAEGAAGATVAGAQEAGKAALIARIAALKQQAATTGATGDDDIPLEE